MNNKFFEILDQVLTIMDYKEDKQKFILEFSDLCFGKTVSDIIEGLPQDKKQMLEKEILDEKDANKQSAIIKKYMSASEYNQRLEKVSGELFGDYIKTIMPTLSPERSAELKSYLSSVKV